ncbi:MAG TPA: universal stress protein [Arthrobacter sp.]|jgi:nucleotide-binding universal stress UspA family protein|nr:universal stress protein [Arthrobacter sp.]
MTSKAAQQRIIVGVDGSHASIEALRHAERLAAEHGAVVEATACWEYSNLYDAYAALGIERPKDEAHQVLTEAIINAFGPVPPGNVTPVLVRGDARRLLIESSKNAAMLVLGNRGHGGFMGLRLGSVTAACVAHAHCPVLVVHANDEILAPAED